MLIKHGSVYQNGEFKDLDILIEDGKIKRIGKHLMSGQTAEDDVICAKGKMILPGAVDVHTHMDLDVGMARAVDDFYTGTVAGGVREERQQSWIIWLLGRKAVRWNIRLINITGWQKVKSVIDYGFHGRDSTCG